MKTAAVTKMRLTRTAQTECVAERVHVCVASNLTGLRLTLQRHHRDEQTWTPNYTEEMDRAHREHLAEIYYFLSQVGLFTKGACWFWQGPRNPGGYGQACYNGVPALAHRFSYRLFIGPFQDDLVICHACDTRLCVNPLHLFPGTQADNMRDRSLKHRARKIASDLNVSHNQFGVRASLSRFAECITPDRASAFRTSRHT